MTDNAANVQKMRNALSEKDNQEIFMFGCSAHILNLLMKDLKVNNVLETIVPVIKYFRNVSSWPVLVSIAEENRPDMVKDVYEAITNLNLKRNVEDYLSILNPISFFWIKFKLQMLTYLMQ